MKQSGLVQARFCMMKLDGLWTFLGDVREELPLVLAAFGGLGPACGLDFTSYSLIDDQRPDVVHDFCWSKKRRTIGV